MIAGAAKGLHGAQLLHAKHPGNVPHAPAGPCPPAPNQRTRKPRPVAVTVLVEGKHALVVVLERKVERLRREVAHHVGGVAAPQRRKALVGHGAAEAVADALVGLRQAALLDHLVLVLDQQLHALDGRGGGLGHGGAARVGGWGVVESIGVRGSTTKAREPGSHDQVRSRPAQLAMRGKGVYRARSKRCMRYGGNCCCRRSASSAACAAAGLPGLRGTPPRLQSHVDHFDCAYARRPAPLRRRKLTRRRPSGSPP